VINFFSGSGSVGLGIERVDWSKMVDALPSQILTVEIIQNLLKSSESEFAELRKCYALLPATFCARKTHCCAMLPEATLVESLWALKRLQQAAPIIRRRVLKKIVAYFFVNPTRITACPFLEKNQCMIYEDRFFGCRAYGLWSLQHYEEIAHQSRRAKKSLAGLWQDLGIPLPEKVINFHLPYCLDVKIVGGAETSDLRLIQLSEQIDSLSGRMIPWHQAFSRTYYADLSYLAASLVFDIRKVLRMKVDIVRNCISYEDRNPLDETLQNVWDFLAPFD
jgi:Fe-S-cluster containining protein